MFSILLSTLFKLNLDIEMIFNFKSMIWIHHLIFLEVKQKRKGRADADKSICYVIRIIDLTSIAIYMLLPVCISVHRYTLTFCYYFGDSSAQDIYHKDLYPIDPWSVNNR